MRVNCGSLAALSQRGGPGMCRAEYDCVRTGREVLQIFHNQLPSFVSTRRVTSATNRQRPKQESPRPRSESGILQGFSLRGPYSMISRSAYT